MAEETTDRQQYDSDADFERPNDEFTFFYKAFRLEERKMCQHQRFEEVTAKYWQLLRADASCDLTQPTISQLQYSALMKRIYKALLPLYRESEMASEISQEWLMDSKGQPALTFQLLTKLLFRIAHQWAINIDIDEYLELLNKIFTRITTLSVIDGERGTTKRRHVIRVDFPQDEKKLVESEGKIDKNAQQDDWLECRSDESNRSEFEYKYEEDPDNMVVKKYKKNKNDLGALGGAGAANMTIKEPFIYNETVLYEGLNDKQEGKALEVPVYVLQELEDIFPFGVAAEQFICWQKNDLQSIKDLNKSQSRKQGSTFGHKNSNKEEEQQANDEPDTGLLDESVSKAKTMKVPSSSYPGRQFEVQITPSLYNSFRKILKNGQNMSLRLNFVHPKAGRSRARSLLNNSDPISEANKFGYNPALERRISYKLIPSFEEGSQVSKLVNVNYLISHPEHETAYRCDVTKVETKSKFSLKETNETMGKKEEEFVHVDTSYRKLREIMLTKKFETISQDRSMADSKEQKRLSKLIDKENKRKAQLMKPGALAQKGLSETYEEQTFIKMTRGPFHQLDSLQGLKEDKFATSAEQDLIDAANRASLRILVIGKPRSGKSTVAKNLANKLDIVHINTENWVNELLEKIKNYEAPDDLPEDADPLGYLSQLESSVYQSLREGKGPSDANNVEILKQMINSPQSRMKGYILDLNFYNRPQSWAATIRQEQLLGPYINGRLVGFSHVIELHCEDEEIKLRAREMRLNPDDNIVYSKWEREERKKPKAQSDEDMDQADDDDEGQVKPFKEEDLIQRVNDTNDQMVQQIQYYNTAERPPLEELLINLYDSQYIKLDSAGIEPDELTECIECRLRPESSLPLRPVGQLVEGCSDYKSILSEGIEEEQVPRKWSLWRQTDPVDLSRGKVVQGLPEYAASFFNNAFVFSSEDNMKVFLEEPKQYLQIPPSMPNIFRVLLLGPKAAGKHSQANLLSELYGWKVVDYNQLVQEKLKELINLEIHIPNNPVPGGRIAMSESELQEIVDGKPMPAWKFIPWIFEYLGHELEKKRPPPPEDKDGDDEPQADDDDDDDKKKKKEIESKKKRDEEEKKRKEEEEVQKQKDERKKRRQEAIDQGLDLVELGLENEDEEIVIIDDLSIDQLALKVDEESGRTPFVGGFIMIGFPESEEQINKLKEHGIGFDKILYLGDTNEDEPGAEIKTRAQNIELYEYDAEVENAQKVLGLVKEHLGEDIVREISCNGSLEDVLIRIRNEIDPFYLKVDNADDVRVTADLAEEDRRIPKGDFGDYCPVTYIRDNWLIKGDPSFEVTIFGKSYWFAGEKEAEIFKLNPSKYVVTGYGGKELPLEPPPPKIMVVGTKGAGVSTQISSLCEKYKLEEFMLKEEYLAKLKEEKEKRKRRRLLDRGFRPPLPPEEEGGEPLPDPEIEEDPSDTFDKEAHERELMQLIFDASKGLVIDATWTDLPEDTVSQPLQDLLVESRRLPEALIVLKCKEQNTFDRLINFNQIKQTYDLMMEERGERIASERVEAERQKLEELKGDEEKTPEDIEREMLEWNDARDQEEAALDDDPEKPNYEEMLEKEKESLKERREKDEQFIEEFSQALRDKGVLVVDEIKADVSAEYVFIKLLDKIRDNFAFRRDLIERQQAQSLKHELVPFYEKSYVYSHSKFGINSPLQLANPTKTKQYAVLYRERIYFPSNEEQQLQFLKEPSKYVLQDTIPLDVSIKPKISILGHPKSGKSTLCRSLVANTGIVHLKVSKIIEQFMNRDSIQSHNLRRIMQTEGKAIEDDLLINLILKRLQFKDCHTKGWILEDFPKTRNQAVYLARKGLVPSNVFYMRSDVGLTSSRAGRKLQEKSTRFGCISDVLCDRLKYLDLNHPNLLSFYQRYYNSVCEIDATRSKWYMEDRAMAQIELNLAARQNFSRSYFLRDFGIEGCKLRDLHMDRCLTKQSWSEFKYYCPVTWKNEKLLVQCSENNEDCVLYNSMFYYFKDTKSRDMFLTNPLRFLQNSSFPLQQELPLRLQLHKAAEVTTIDKSLDGHCSVSLMDEERVVRGDPLLLIFHKDGKYLFDTEYKLQRFLANPYKYLKATLPVKMPPPTDKVSLHNLQKMEDSISFMEQALGQIVTRALREVSENRLKYPTISIKETMLKLFSLFLKTENPANTAYMKQKYADKLKQFIERCEISEELYDLYQEKEKRKEKGSWPEFKENYYNQIGAEFDNTLKVVEQEKLENFTNYIR